MILSLEHLYALYYGGDQITREFLQPLAANEPEESLNLRFSKAAYMNIVGFGVNTYMGYCFSGPVKESDVKAYRNLTPTLISSTFHSIVGGEALLVALADQDDLVTIPRTQYKPQKDGTTRAEVVVDGKKATWIITPDKILQTIEEGRTTERARNEKSVRFVSWNELKQSLIADVAAYAVKIYNYDSIADRQADATAFWVTSGPALSPEQKSIQPYQHFARNNVEVPEPKFHNPETQQMENIDKRIDRFILRAGKTIGLQKEFADVFSTGSSGLAQAMQMVSTNAIVSMIVKANVSAVNEVAEWGGKLKGQKGGSVTLEPALTPQAKAELVRLLMEGAQTINTAEAAEVYAEEIVKATLAGAPEAQLKRALDSIQGKGLAVLKNPATLFQ